jgi:hypothetical protein
MAQSKRLMAAVWPLPYRQLSIALCFVAGLLYNSWPLGYLLDSSTAHHSLASDLELANHPYYRLFITCDVLTAVCVILAALILFKWSSSPPKIKTVVLAGLIIFAVFTAASAVLPDEYSVTYLLKWGTHKQPVGIDTISSSLAALGLFAGLIGLAIARLKSNVGRIPLNRITRLILATWSASGLAFIFLALTNQDARFSEDVLMIVTGLAIAAIGLALGLNEPSQEF